jgi:hypothetical protein
MQTKSHFSIMATSFAGGPRPRNVAVILFGLWALLFFASLFAPPLLDDADATHAQAAQAMVRTGDLVTLRVDGVRYLEKAPLPYWLTAASFRLFGFNTFAAHLPTALTVLLLMLLGHRWANQAFGARTGFYTALALLTSLGVFLFTRILIPEALLSLTLGAALFAFLKAVNPDGIGIPGLRGHRVPDTLQPPRYEWVGGAPPPEAPAVAWYAGPLFYPYVMWASLALAVLAKGLVALILFGIPAVLYLTLVAEWKLRWRLLRPFSGLTLFLLIAAPWHVLAGLRNPASASSTGHGFFWFYFWNEHVLRFLGRRQPQDYNKMPGYLFWLQHLLWLFPWSLFLPLGVVALWRRFRHQQALGAHADQDRSSAGKRSRSIEDWRALVGIGAVLIFSILSNRMPFFVTSFFLAALILPPLTLAVARIKTKLPASPFHRIDPQQRSILLLSLFAGTVLLFFSVSTNQEYYTFPAYLPLLLLIAATITRAEQTYSSSAESRRWITFAHTAITVIGALGALALLAGLWSSRHLAYTPDIGSLLAHRSVGHYTLSTSHLFDLTGAAFASLRMPALLAVFVLLAGPNIASALRMQRRHIAATTAVGLTAAAFLLCAQVAFARFAPMLSSASFAQTISTLEHTGTIAADSQVLLLGDQSYGSSIPFYLGHPVGLVDGRSSSLLIGSTFSDSPSPFLTEPQLLAAWGNGPRKLLFIPAEQRDDAARLLSGHPQFPIMESGNKLLISDRPVPME